MADNPMDQLIQVVKKLLPEGTDVVKIYKAETGEIKVDIKMGDMEMTCTLKKNHDGQFYVE